MDSAQLLCYIVFFLSCIQGTHGRNCDGKVNIVVGMDSSQSLESYQYKIITLYAASLMERLNYIEGAAVLAFSNEVNLVADFGEMTDSNPAALDSIRQYPHMNIAATRIDRLIRNLTDKLSGDNRINPSIPRVGVVVTDGRNTGTIDGLRAATQHADRNMVDIVTVGVGSSYSRYELSIMTNQIEDNIIESPTFNELLNQALEKSVQRICLLSHDGDVTSKVCSGYFVLGIHVDVTDQNFNTTQSFLTDLLMNRLQFNHLYSDIVLTIGQNGAKQRFSDQNGLSEFLGQMVNDDSSTGPSFDPVAAYNRMADEFNQEDDFVQNIAMFITDKLVNDINYANEYFTQIVRNQDNVEVLTVGITPDSNPDELLALAGGMAMHRILTTPTSYLTSGRNKLTTALCHIMDRSPIKVIVEFSSTSFTLEESHSVPKYRTVTLTRKSVDLSSTSSVFVESYTVPGIQGSATMLKDYMPVRQTITFQPGEGSKNVSILILPDQDIEQLEHFMLSVSSPQNCSIGYRNTTSVFIVDKTELYKGPSEVAVAFKYCPPPYGTDTGNTYLKYMGYMKKLVQHSKISLSEVQLTAQAFCKELFTLTSSKTYMPTFHVPKGLQAGGSASHLHGTLSEATGEMARVLDRQKSENKFIFVIFHDKYEQDPLIASTITEAAFKGIHVIPLVLSKDNLSVTSVTLPQGYLPYHIYLDELENFDYSLLRSFLQQKYSTNLTAVQPGWTNIGITMNSQGLDQNTLTLIQKFVSEMTGLYSQQSTASSYEKMMQDDLSLYTNNPVKYIVRNTNLPIQRMIDRSQQSTTPAGKKVLLLMVTGASTVPGVLATAAKARQKGIKIIVMGINIDEDTKEELLAVSGNNLKLFTGFSSLPIAVIGSVGFEISEEMAQIPGHIMVALDSSEAVSDADLKNMIGAVNNLARLWSIKLDGTKMTIGMFSDIYVDIVDGVLSRMFSATYGSQLQKLSHLKEMTSSSRMILEAANSLRENQESTDVTQVAIVVPTGPEPVSTFVGLASGTAQRDGVEVITVGQSSPSFINTVTLDQATLNNANSASIAAAQAVAKLPTGNHNILLALPADESLNDKLFQWTKNFALKLTSLLTSKANLNKFGIISYSAQHNVYDVSQFDTLDSSNFAAVIKNITRYSKLGPDIRTDVYLKSLLNIYDTEFSQSPKAAIILQDENSKSRHATQSAALEAYKHGINLLVLGVGQDIDNSEMDAISYFTKDYTTRISSDNLLETDGLRWTLNTLKSIEPIHLYRQTRLELEDCYGAADLAFAMDASMSLQENYFDAIKETVAETIRHLNMSDDAFRVRVALTFDGAVVIVAQDETSKEDLIQKVEGAILTGGLTKMYLAINKTTEHLLKPPERNVQKLAVLITDGKSLDRQLTIKEAKYAAENNITNIAMAIGDELSVSRAELMDVVANKSENILWLKTFEELRLYGAAQLLTHICNMSRIEQEESSTTSLMTSPSTTSQPILSTTTMQTTTTEKNTIPPIRIVTDEACIGASIGQDGFGYVSHPYECDQYVICDSKLTVHDIKNCPLHTFWDNDGKDCNIIEHTTCSVDTCIGKPDDFNYTTPRLKNDPATCNRYYTCINEKTSHVCECMGRLSKVMIEGVVAEVRRVGQKFDPTTSTCVDDLVNQCSTYLDPNDLVQPKILTCNKVQLSPNKYHDLTTSVIHTCPGDLVYQPKICDCEEKTMEGTNPSNQNSCHLFVDYTFDNKDTEEELNHIQYDLHRGGQFIGSNGVVIDGLSDYSDTQFAVQMEIERTGDGNMVIFKNCISTATTTLSLYFMERQSDVLVLAELAALSGKYTLTAISQNLKNKIKVVITLAANNQKIALWVKKTNGVLEGKDEMHFPKAVSTLDLSCEGPLQLGGHFGKGSKGFHGYLDEFRWYKGDMSGCQRDDFIDETIVDIMKV